MDGVPNSKRFGAPSIIMFIHKTQLKVRVYYISKALVFSFAQFHHLQIDCNNRRRLIDLLG